MVRPTAIWNQDSIVELLTRELARTAREGGDLCVMLAGIDPPQNGSPEQQAQREALLGEIAKRFTSLLRTYDHVGRYGTDQLLIVVPGCSLASMLPVAEKLRQAVAQSSVEAGGASFPVTVSLALTDGAARSDAEVIRELEWPSSPGAGARWKPRGVGEKAPGHHRPCRAPAPNPLLIVGWGRITCGRYRAVFFRPIDVVRAFSLAGHP